MSHGEVLSAADVGRRRGRSDEDEVWIIVGSLRGSRQGAPTAQRYGISRSLLTRWRRAFREGVLRTAIPLGFMPLQIAPEVPRPAPAKTCSQAGSDRLEVVLTNGRRLVVGLDVDFEKLVRLVQGLERA